MIKLKRYLLVIGTDEFSGAGRITKFFKDSLKKQKIGFLSYLYIGNSSKQKKQNFKNFQVSKFNKFLNFFKIIFKIFKNKKKIKALYLQENAGLGKIYDIFIILIFRIYSKPIFYHNHSSGKYINFDLLTKIIQIISGEKLINIFLSRIESRKYIYRYGNLEKYYCISNSIFIRKIKASNKKNKSLKTLKFGLISQLTKEKGFEQFINLAKYSQEKNKKWNFYVAGPIPINEKYYLNQISKLSNIKYLGVIDNSQKKILFYSKLNYFIFLSTYFHESEPLVILEAISNGVIPIVYNRGSISELICSKELIINSKSDPYLAIEKIVEKFNDKNKFKRLYAKSTKNYLNLREKSKIQFFELIHSIKSIP